MANYIVTDTDLAAVADAIRAKGGTSAQLEFPSEFVSAIGAISTSTSEAEEKDVNFIDYDGTILYSYTAEEFAALTEMPANPSHDGLIAQGWNWTMADAKSHTAEVGELWVGQMYTTESGATEIDVIIQETIKDITFTISVNGVASIDFGDNTPAVEVAGNDISVSVETNHVYQYGGRYTIKVSAVSGEYSFARSETNSALFKFSAPEGITVSTTAYEQFCGYTVLCVRIGNGISTLKARAFANCSSMESVSVPISVTAMEGGCFSSCSKLNAFVFPKNYEMTSGQGGSAAIITGDSVKYIAVNALSSIKHTLCSSQSLRRAVIPNTVTSIASSPTASFGPYASTALTKLVIPQSVATIGGSLFSLMYVLQEVHFKRTTPPTVQYSSTGNPQRFTKIYVPEGSLSAYTENSKYPKATVYSYFEE